jgi:hypothetical protein
MHQALGRPFDIVYLTGGCPPWTACRPRGKSDAEHPANLVLVSAHGKRCKSRRARRRPADKPAALSVLRHDDKPHAARPEFCTSMAVAC